MKKFLLIILISFTSFEVFAQNEGYRDVVYLKNGNVIKGLILEQVLGSSVSIKTSDGSVFVYNENEISKIEKELIAQKYSGNQYVPGYDKKSPALAWFCSFLIPGLGQMVINEQYGKGIAMFLGYGAAIGVCYAGAINSDEIMTISGAAATLGIFFWSMIDAPVVAKKLNKQNLLSYEVGNGELSLKPDVAFYSLNVSNPSNITPTVGMKLTYRF